MKSNHLTPAKLIENPQIWILGIAAGLMAIILTLTWRSGDVSQMGMSLLFLFAVASLLGEKRHKLSLESGIFPSVVGLSLIALILWQSTYLLGGQWLATFTHASPVIAAISLGLLASGFKGLKQYWQEITILFFLGIPKLIFSSITDISPITAKFSAFVLWYSGFNVSLHQGIYIHLPTGSIKVYSGCSGVELISHMLGLAVIALLMFPIQRKKSILVLAVAVISAFIVNGIRVALLAVVVSNQRAFDYWHEGDGSRLFGIIAVVILGLFYYFLIQQQSKKQGNAGS
ncbi:MAG: cyanoexosortase A [Desmonostoc vinosum HA7617-LM4]|jgi:cyanoexosortase A|nr:cyanoexosortase A [Desmonostoc vinosum HA7617-LM4]